MFSSLLLREHPLLADCSIHSSSFFFFLFLIVWCSESPHFWKNGKSEFLIYIYIYIVLQPRSFGGIAPLFLLKKRKLYYLAKNKLGCKISSVEGESLVYFLLILEMTFFYCHHSHFFCFLIMTH